MKLVAAILLAILMFASAVAPVFQLTGESIFLLCEEEKPEKTEADTKEAKEYLGFLSCEAEYLSASAKKFKAQPGRHLLVPLLELPTPPPDAVC